VVRDLGAPGARLLDIELPDGNRVKVAEHLCGWAPAADPDGPLWPTMADAVAALSGRTRDGEPWISVLEEFATSPANPGGEVLPAAEDARLAALMAASPAIHVDGPRAHHSGGWYMFIGGLPLTGWVMEYGDTPDAAARAALDRAERLVGLGGG
jgi:hypothetical protein